MQSEPGRVQARACQRRLLQQGERRKDEQPSSPYPYPPLQFLPLLLLQQRFTCQRTHHFGGEGGVHSDGGSNAEGDEGDVSYMYCPPVSSSVLQGFPVL